MQAYHSKWDDPQSAKDSLSADPLDGIQHEWEMSNSEYRTAQSSRGRATEAQAEYLSILFIDCGFTLVQRKGWLLKRFGREVVFVDDLTKLEASQAISELKQQKEGAA